jgi:hypothetical protein
MYLVQESQERGKGMRESTRERLTTKPLTPLTRWAMGSKVDKVANTTEFKPYMNPALRPCPCGGPHQARHHHIHPRVSASQVGWSA